MNGCAVFYTVEEGNTILSIAELFGTSPESILRLNPSVDPDNLEIGTRLCVVSATVQPVQCPPGSVAYNINRGDTLRIIAERFGTTAENILLTNPTLDPYNLRVGQRICIEQPIPELPDCKTRNFYVIRSGDTLGAIAASFGVKASEIRAANPGINPNNLTVGSVICIPLAPSPIDVIINVAAKRLTVYRKGSIYREYIIATGKPETPTPIGNFTIINKELDPGGPYGTRWLGLSKRGYGIHGTNNPPSIGTAASNGCIRMYNEDAEALFDMTPIGTSVRILP